MKTKKQLIKDYVQAYKKNPENEKSIRAFSRMGLACWSKESWEDVYQEWKKSHPRVSSPSVK